MRRLWIAPWCWCLLAGAFAQTAATTPPAGLKPLAEILDAVQRRHSGRVIDIDLEHGSDGRRWYEITIANGQRSKLFIDAVTGQEIPEPGKQPANLVSLSQVLRNLAISRPGLVLEAELEGGSGEPPRYDIKLLGPQGEIHEVSVDARTGVRLAGTAVLPAAASGLVPLDRLLAALERRYKGRVTEAELKFNPVQRPYYEVELVTESGRNLELRVDARSGQAIADSELAR